jgi:hypothetical protein
MKDSKKLAKEIMEAALAGEDVDLYQQRPEDWEFLAEFIPGLKITSAGGMLPFQALGTLHGFPFYFRARHEWATLHLSAPGTDPVGWEHLYYASCEAPFHFTAQDFCEIMLKIVPQIKRASFRWEFDGHKLHFPDPKKWEAVQSEEKDTHYGWGVTPEEGWLATQEMSEYLLEHGCSEETQRRFNELREISKTPLNQDTRVFPESDPVFEVRWPEAS